MNRLATILIVINLLGLAGVVTWFVLKDRKLVYVDSIKLINSYKGMTEARNAYQQKALTWKANVDTLAKELEARIAKYKKEATSMTAREKKLEEEILTSKQKQLRDYENALAQKAKDEDAEMSRAILVEINSYLKKYGENKGYDIILAATDYGNIAYAKPGLDITDDVIEGLNGQYGK